MSSLDENEINFEMRKAYHTTMGGLISELEESIKNQRQNVLLDFKLESLNWHPFFKNDIVLKTSYGVTEISEFISKVKLFCAVDKYDAPLWQAGNLEGEEKAIIYTMGRGNRLEFLTKQIQPLIG